MPILTAFLGSLVLSSLLTPAFRSLSGKIAFVDLPQAKKFHKSATPLLGGVAVFLAWQIALIVGNLMLKGGIGGRELTISLGAVFTVLLGLVDDRHGMNPLVKLGGQTLAGVILILGSGAAAVTSYPQLNFAISIVWTVGLMNALNFLDNMDGVSSGVSFLAALFFFVLASFSGEVSSSLTAAALAGATLGFLRYNFSPASIFMGDAGSIFLGYSLSALSLGAIPHELSGAAVFVPVLILGYPVFDISFVTVVRLSEGRKVYQGGKDHTSHRMAARFGSVPKACAAIYAICLVLGLTGFFVYGMASVVPALAYAFVVATTLLLVVFGIALYRSVASC